MLWNMILSFKMKWDVIYDHFLIDKYDWIDKYGKYGDGDAIYLATLSRKKIWTTWMLALWVIYTTYKKFKVQIISILEEIDSFYWPKMHFWKGAKKLGRALPPIIGTKSNREHFFLRRTSLTLKWRSKKSRCRWLRRRQLIWCLCLNFGQGFQTKVSQTGHFVLLVKTMIMMMCVRSGRIRGCDP